MVPSAEPTGPGAERILLLLANAENRRLLAAWLGRRYAVCIPEPPEAPEPLFDLCIVDLPMLERFGAWAAAVRRAEQPVLLPFLLMTQRSAAQTAAAGLWRCIDDLIITPAEKPELRARVEALLHARRLSLANAVLSRQLEAELDRAGAVQAALLPHTPPALPGLDLAAGCRSARETGGDFYDWQTEPPAGALALQLGDVMGKGMPAALLMTATRATLRALAAEHAPGAALERLRAALGADLQRIGSFVTLFHARIELDACRVRYAAAGHGYSFILAPDGTVRPLDPVDVPIGVPSGRPSHEGSFVLASGAALVIHSDGLLDLLPAGERGPAALAARLHGAGSAAAMVEALLAPGAGRTLPDDLTVVILRRAPR